MSCTSKYSYAADHLAKTTAHPIHFHEHMACPVINPDIGVSLEYCHLIQVPDKYIWVKALANDFGRLAQGVKDIIPTGNSTIFFIHPNEIPAHKKVTYSRLVLDIRPLKEEKYRVRITVGGDKLDFCGDASSVTAYLATVKILLNSVVSTKGAKFTTAIFFQILELILVNDFLRNHIQFHLHVLWVWQKRGIEKSFISAVVNFSPFVETTLSRRSFTVAREAVTDEASPQKSNLSPPTVMRTRYFSSSRV